MRAPGTGARAPSSDVKAVCQPQRGALCLCEQERLWVRGESLQKSTGGEALFAHAFSERLRTCVSVKVASVPNPTVDPSTHTGRQHPAQGIVLFPWVQGGVENVENNSGTS